MIRQRINSVWLFVLLTAFLAVQWTPPHAHLASPHDHSDGRHQHSAEAHAHQPVVSHADAIDSGHFQLDETQVVELDHDASPANGCPLDAPPATWLVEAHYPLIGEAMVFGTPPGHNALPSSRPPHIGQPRAPPSLA